MKTWTNTCTILLISGLYGFNSFVESFLFKSGQRLQLTPFRKIPNIPLGKCQEECISRLRCKSLAYQRHAGVCMLYGEDTSSAGAVLDPRITYSEKKHWEATPLALSCNGICRHTDVCRVQDSVTSCTSEECGTPGAIGDGPTQVLGNMRNIGSKVLYVCNGYDDFPGLQTTPWTMQSECIQGGTWLHARPDAHCYHNLSSIVRYKGCFVDSRSRILSAEHVREDTMTIGLCARYCYVRHYTYFGLEFYHYCFCGSVIHYKGMSDGCTTPCGGDTEEMCGGSWRMDIYSYKLDPAQ